MKTFYLIWTNAGKRRNNASIILAESYALAVRTYRKFYPDAGADVNGCRLDSYLEGSSDLAMHVGNL